MISALQNISYFVFVRKKSGTKAKCKIQYFVLDRISLLKEELNFTLLESRSTSQISSGKANPFLYIRKLDGTPMMKGVGASSN